MLEKRWFRWLLALVAWTFLALFFFTQTYLTYLYSPNARQIPTGLILQVSLSEWYTWALLAPGVIWLARRFPLGRERWVRCLAVHVPASVVIAVAKYFLYVLVRQRVLGIEGMPNIFFQLHPNVVTYWVIVGLTLGFDYYRKFRERELRASRLEAQLSEARLQVLKMQLHPHFLFNTLHAISTLMHRDVEAADRMVSRLGELLRMTLDTAEQQEVPLKRELEFLERYLDSEQPRFQDRLTVKMQIAPEALDAQVPNLILQPIVENAIRHGIAARAGPGSVEIIARRAGSRLEVEIRDTGAGLSEGHENARSEGVGLANTRARLAQLYGSDGSFALAGAPGGGVVASLSIPWNTAGSAE